MNLINKKRVIKIAVSLISLLIVLVIIYYGFLFLRQRNGIELKPIHKVTAYNVQTYLQNDDLWGDDKIGMTDYTMSHSGCLVSIIASNLEYQGFKTNPKELNGILSKDSVYNEEGEILWEKLVTILPYYKYSAPKQIEVSKIQENLDKGILPMVKVRYKRIWGYHWVLIVGATDEDFLIVDPLNQDKEVIKLSEHGKIFAVRYLSKAL